MLQHVTAEHFRTQLQRHCALRLEDGSDLPVVIASVEDKPLARLCDEQRTPFSVGLSSLQPSTFIDGLCSIELPELGTLESVFVSRVPALGRDPELAYYHISFN